MFEHVPLFVSTPDVDEDDTADALCLTARRAPPYAQRVPGNLTLDYEFCLADDVRQVLAAGTLIQGLFPILDIKLINIG